MLKIELLKNCAGTIKYTTNEAFSLRLINHHSVFVRGQIAPTIGRLYEAAAIVNYLPIARHRHPKICNETREEKSCNSILKGLECAANQGYPAADASFHSEPLTTATFSSQHEEDTKCSKPSGSNLLLGLRVWQS